MEISRPNLGYPRLPLENKSQKSLESRKALLYPDLQDLYKINPM
jgi:hypothetical protein